MKRTFITIMIFSLMMISGLYSVSTHFKETKDSKIYRVAREIIGSSKFCVLISTGVDGYPNARMMEYFQPDEKWTIRMGTNRNSRKVKEIKKDNKISLYYESSDGDGYLLLKGEGSIVEDSDEKLKYFKKGWEKYYPGKRENFVIIKFVPIKLEIVSYKNGLIGDNVTWEAPSLIFNTNK